MPRTISSIADVFRTTLDLFDTGLNLMRQNLKRSLLRLVVFLRPRRFGTNRADAPAGPDHAPSIDVDPAMDPWVLFADELKQLQPSPGYMRLVKELVLRAWQERQAEVGREAADTERRAKAIQQKLDRLDEAFLLA